MKIILNNTYIHTIINIELSTLKTQQEKEKQQQQQIKRRSSINTN